MLRAYLEPRSGEGPAPLVLGCMNFGARTSRDASLRMIDRATEAGIALLDTANAYQGGASERIVGEAVRGRPGLRVATKVGYGRIEGRLEGLSATRIEAACDASLERLGLDTIDLYYLHVPDHGTPLAESVGAIAALLRSGRIRHWGVSNFASWQILELNRLAAGAGIEAPRVAQQLYNALIRQLDLEYFTFTAAHPIHTTVYNPLAGGVLAGGYTLDATVPRGSRFDGNAMYRGRYWRRAMFEAVDALTVVARDEGLSVLELAYAFVLRHPRVDSVLVGPSQEAHLQAALDARAIVLSPEALHRIDGVYHDLVGTDASYAR